MNLNAEAVAAQLEAAAALIRQQAAEIERRDAAERARAARPPETQPKLRIWTVTDVAEYLQQSVALGNPGLCTTHARRWRPEDVRAWVDRQKGKVA